MVFCRLGRVFLIGRALFVLPCLAGFVLVLSRVSIGLGVLGSIASVMSVLGCRIGSSIPWLPSGSIQPGSVFLWLACIGRLLGVAVHLVVRSDQMVPAVYFVVVAAGALAVGCVDVSLVERCEGVGVGGGVGWCVGGVAAPVGMWGHIGDVAVRGAGVGGGGGGEGENVGVGGIMGLVVPVVLLVWALLLWDRCVV